LIVDSPAGKLANCCDVPCSHNTKKDHNPAWPKVHGLRAGFFDNGEEPADLQAVPEKTLAKCQWHPKSHRDSATPPVYKCYTKTD
jgi:hypothetical protein